MSETPFGPGGLGPGEVNLVWARALMDELARLGVRDVCVAPGSRSTPLVLAAAAVDRLGMRVFLDERSAAFFALGVGRGSGRPAVVLTTSGTAVSNLHPAVVEASMAEVPLLVLTADRPRRLRGSDANQTIDQPGLFGGYVRAAHDLPPASLDPADVRHLRVLVDRSVADALGAPAGPVHLNVPFAKPLEPARGLHVPAPEEVVPDAYREGRPGRPAVRITRRRALLEDGEIEALVGRLDRARRPVLVAGPVPDPEETGAALVELAESAGTPLLADPLSGARWRRLRSAVVLGAYDLFLDAPEARAALRPDFVLRVGQAPTSTRLAAWLEEHRDVRQVVLDPGDRWKDHALAADTYLRASPADTLRELAGRVAPHAPAEWRARWRVLEEVTHAAQAGSDAFEPGHEGHLMARTVERVRPGDELFVGSSMPVRDLDAFGAPAPRDHPLLARANRGASGIDGTVSTALGVAAGTGRRVVAVLGDVAFVHDMNGLLATREKDLTVVFVVVHNDGGGIFHMLPVRGHEPHFTPYFATPHGLDFRHAAAMYGLPWQRVGDPTEYADALSAALDEGGCRVVEVRTDRHENEVRRRTLREAIRAAVLEALEAQEE